MKVLKYLRRITLVTLLLLAGQLAWAQADNTPENSTLGEGKGNISAQSKSAEGIFINYLIAKRIYNYETGYVRV